jgi:hypothetical protein
MPEKKGSNKYDVSIQSTNGPVISAIGPNARVTITQRTMLGNVEHFYCGSCRAYVPISQYRVHQSEH